MYRAPLTILTIFHPEHWLNVPTSELRHLAHISRQRSKLEETRKQFAKERDLKVSTSMFHDRPIANLGTSLDQFRRTWIDDSASLAACFINLRVRLFIYDEEGSQAKYRLECRYDWGTDTNSIDAELILAA